MFITAEETERLTGSEVTNEQIFIAQSLIEAYIGRVEAQIDDVSDKENLAKAVAYQTVYMKDNSDTVFKQIDVQSVSNFGSNIVFRYNGPSPYIATAARFALKNLSWKGSRTVKTGKIMQGARHQYDWTRDDN